MNQFIGTKVVNAKPMSLLEYDRFRGCKLDTDGCEDIPGYLVEYTDGGKANTEHFEGYVSWSPKEVFDKAYRPVSGLTFGAALEGLKSGNRVARDGWYGKGMWLSLSGPMGGKRIPAASFWSQRNAEYADQTIDGHANVLPCITMKTAAGDIQMGWLASQADMLAEDWFVIGDTR